MAPRSLLPVAVVAALAAAGCGSTSHTAGGSRSSTAQSTSAGLAAQPPQHILAAAAAALHAARGYTMSGYVDQAGRTLRIRLRTTSPTSLDLTFSTGRATAELIGLPGGSYIRGNSTFWRSQAGSRATKLSGRWIQVPYSNARALTSSLGSLAPATLSRCLMEDHGTLTVAGKTTVAGQAAVIIKDAGNVPGSSAGDLTVAAHGTPYPLRYSATGNQRAGGRIDVCNTGKASSARGTITFGQFDHVAPIRAPKHAVQPSSGPKA